MSRKIFLFIAYVFIFLNCNASMKFDGTNDEVLITGVTTITQPFTFVAWIKDETGNNNKPFFSYDTDDNDGFRVLNNLGSITLIFGGVAVYTFGAIPDMPNNIWTFVAITVNGTSAKCFRDIFTETATVGTMGGTPNRVRIGSFSVSAQYFQGSMADVRLYRRVLSDNEIYSLYYGISRLNITDGLVGYWPLMQGADNTNANGATIYDRSGNGYNGTASGGNGPLFFGSDKLMYP